MLRHNFAGEDLARWAEALYGSRTVGASALALKLGAERRHVAQWFAGKVRIPEDVRERIFLLVGDDTVHGGWSDYASQRQKE